ncbi:MAG TPA: DUF3096 domain-containing protein [Candidatus Nanoarchaeia archaeon]|nr:DUF3096 domain-containing protein [Candidatus Nanoarchaeia archaeon]
MISKKTSKISSIVSIIAGIIILLWPNTLNVAVALYLLIVGILGLVNR